MGISGFMNSLAANDHWTRHAQQWAAVQPPLRPSAQDIAVPRMVVQEWLQNNQHTGPAVLILGVTRELCSLPFNGSGKVIAVDKSAEMIQTLWRPNARGRTKVICADWRDIPLDDASVDLAFADGAFTPLPFPSGYAEVCAELRRLLRPMGQCVIRCFVQAEERESVENVFKDLSRGRIGNFHVLKWRLAMALQSDAEEGVVLGSVWDTLHTAWPKLEALADFFGWLEAEVRTIEAYREVETRYTFPTLAQHCQLFSSAGFSVTKIVTPEYELGERCPTVVLQRI